MKTAKNTLRFSAVLLVLVLVCTACAPSLSSVLPGTWHAKNAFTTDELYDVLSYLNFDDEELKYAPAAENFWFVQQFVFRSDGSYSKGLDVAATKKVFTAYLDSYMQSLYDNFALIAEYYGAEPSDCETVDDMKLFQAACCDCESYEEYVDLLWMGMIEDFTYLDGSELEAGTYTVEGNDINYAAEGSDEIVYVTAKVVSETALDIEYGDGADRWEKVA